MFWIELIIVLAIIFIGVRVGGTFLAMAGGIGMFIMTFILHVTPVSYTHLDVYKRQCGIRPKRDK